MPLTIITLLLSSIFLVSCRSDKHATDPVSNKNPTIDLINKLKDLDSKSVLKGKDFIQCFPNADFQRYAIRMAIGGLEIDEWRIDNEVSLLLYPKSKEWTPPYEIRNTGVNLDIEPSEDSYSMPELPAQVTSDSINNYFGPTSSPQHKGLNPECEYLKFILIKRGEFFLEDLKIDPLYSSGNITKVQRSSPSR